MTEVNAASCASTAGLASKEVPTTADPLDLHGRDPVRSKLASTKPSVCEFRERKHRARKSAWTSDRRHTVGGIDQSHTPDSICTSEQKEAAASKIDDDHGGNEKSPPPPPPSGVLSLDGVDEPMRVYTVEEAVKALYPSPDVKQVLHITKLNMSYQGFGCFGAYYIGNALPHNTSVKELDLTGNSIMGNGIRCIAKGLLSNSTLESLDLSYNSVGHEGAMSIAQVLQTNRSLTSLHLGGNGIGPTGARVMMAAIDANHVVTTLHIGHNNIKQAGAKSVAEVLQRNASLTNLGLGFNKMGQGGAELIANALKSNHTLTALYLGGNHINNSGLEKIAGALEVNHTLTTLQLGGNDFGQASTERIIGVFKKNALITSQGPWVYSRIVQVLVLTAHCKSQGSGILTLTFTSIGGEERAVVTVGRSSLLAPLLTELHARLDHPGQRLELLTDDGRPLKDPTGKATLGDMFGIPPETRLAGSLQEASF